MPTTTTTIDPATKYCGRQDGEETVGVKRTFLVLGLVSYNVSRQSIFMKLCAMYQR